VVIPERVAFHAFRHTYGAWMRRHAGLDTSGLVGTRAWLSHAAARVYEHVDTREEARKADFLPTPNPGETALAKRLMLTIKVTPLGKGEVVSSILPGSTIKTP
jgi:hypothetical protein